MLRRALIAATATLACLGALVAGAAGASATTLLYSGQSLASGQSLTSADGHYVLTMETDGNLVLATANPHASPRALFSSGTGDSPGATAELQANGDLVVLDTGGSVIWSNDAQTSGCANLLLQNDGNLVAYSATGAYWATNTRQETMAPDDELLGGQTLIAPGSLYRLQMSTAGTLSLVDSAGTVWSAPSGPPGSYAVIYSDGDFEVISPTNTRVWYTKTYASADARSTVQLTSDGDVEVVTPAGTTTWSSGTGASRSGLHSLNQPPSFSACPAATPTPTPAPAPPVTTKPVKVTLRGIDVRMAIRWHYHQRVTFAKAVTVGRFPRRAVLTITCRGRRGCPTHLVRVHHRRVRRPLVLRADGRHLRPLLHRLTTLRFRAGDVLTLTVTERGRRTSRLQVRIRDGSPPVNRVVRG